MSREIKFRAWDGVNMIYTDGGEYHLCVWGGPGRIPWGIYSDADESRLMTGDPKALFNKPATLMQYTGLQDKDGKDVYEGDIIEFSLMEGDKEYGVVRFSDGGFWTSQDTKHQEELLSDELKSKSLSAIVIGNIYENPKLLKQ